MRTFYFILALAGAATSACKSHPAAKTTAPTIPSSSSTADADDIGAPKYAVCDEAGPRLVAMDGLFAGKS